MGGACNKVTVIGAAGAETWDEMPKSDVARQLALRIADALT
jgi:phosphopantothenoylcysteine decarboxylase/phosphopantothenate--cysteine ligase